MGGGIWWTDWPYEEFYIKMRAEQSFNEYIIFLRETLSFLSQYWEKIGRKHPYIEDIQDGLNHSDPFILYKASIAASLLLEDKRIYH